MRNFNFLFIIAVVAFIALFPTLAAFAQDLVDTVPTAASNSVCVEGTCLTGVSALIMTIATGLVFLGNFLIKIPKLQDTSKWYGKLVHYIANIKYTTKK